MLKKMIYIPRRLLYTALVCCALAAPLFAAEEYTDGRIKLVLDDNLGKFLLYYMTDVEKQTYEPLFWDKDKRTSYLSAFIDGRVYVLGE
ncbi:MAG: hypothetical protein LBC72_02295, partial [Spirochaetaceae bacterium]|nr:hypothetical protein [Spirochaetaceae bacterium]